MQTVSIQTASKQYDVWIGERVIEEVRFLYKQILQTEQKYLLLRMKQ